MVRKSPAAAARVTLIADLVGLALETGGNLAGIKAKTDNLDTTLTVNAALNRWGRNVAPVWVNGTEQTAPGANTALVTQAVTAGKTGYIYGLEISAEEGNDFKLNWTSGTAAKSMRFVFAGAGSIHLDSPIAINEGWGADASSNVTITNVTAAGSGKIYQARLLYAEL